MIQEHLGFGIDIGIGSCGWAVLAYPGAGEPGSIKGAGAWCFDVPETDKERTPTNQIRRGNRLLRRVIRRRRNRMNEIRGLLHEQGLLSAQHRDALKQPGLDPWECRARGLDKRLAPVEFAIALAHIAKRRGFKSAAKQKGANKSDDDKKMLAALDKTKERLAHYRTLGEMLARDPDYTARRRNRSGIFDRTAGRDDLEYEVGQLFSAQRRLGQAFATAALEEGFKNIAFRQLPMQDSERLLGACQFEPGETRASKLAPSFEAFRLLTRLINLRVVVAGSDGWRKSTSERALTVEELARATADLGSTAKLSVAAVRKRIGLGEEERFSSIKPSKNETLAEVEKLDIVARTGEAMPGTAALRKAIGEELWPTMQAQPDKLDSIAHVLSFFETNDTITKKLQDLGLDDAVLGKLFVALEQGRFEKFKGAGYISSKACRNLLPYLRQGHRYDEACALVGYNHAASSLSQDKQIVTKAEFNALVAELGDLIANPIARKSVTEALKQLWAMRNRWGLPGSISVELARDVGNSLEKRQEIEKGIKDNTSKRERERKEIRELLKIEDINSETLLRYRLWKEQNGECLYTGKSIGIQQIIQTDNSVQVDHILPWSRFGDNSFNNKTLCLASANQRKKGQTPFEWLSDAEWGTFMARVEGNKELRGIKKRNLLLKNAKEAAEKFRSRNLNDTRYAARVFAEAAKLLYPPGHRQEKGGNRRVFTRPGALTSVLRQAWGVESLKKVAGKRIEDDRHHALDAIVLAAVSERQVQHLTKSYQEWEQQGLARPLRSVAPPWDGFRQDVEATYEQVLVARPERRRARGEGHAATIRQIDEESGVIFERKGITGLEEKDLARIKDPERNAAIVAALRDWIAAGKPADAPPRSPKGDVISKLRLATKNKPGVLVRGGAADRGEMVRVDVFSKPNRKGKAEWYLVPIYRHQVMSRKAYPTPPMQAVVAHKDEADWEMMGPEHEFCFSLYARSYVEVVKPKDGEIQEGYFSGLNRSTGAITLSFPNNTKNTIQGIGAKTLISIKKYAVDRFGARAEIQREARTWHGEVCIFPSPAG